MEAEEGHTKYFKIKNQISYSKPNIFFKTENIVQNPNFFSNPIFLYRTTEFRILDI